jgi:TonB family protein
MKVATLCSRCFRSSTFLLFVAVVMSPALFAVFALAQQPAQLSLADILIALRSKKVTLQERNKILADAVKSRGITFALTPEIEKELDGTGADLGLVAAIREKNPAPQKAVEMIAAAERPKPAPVPVATPAPPDFSFYQKRADDLASRGDYDGAISDYGKAIELKPASSGSYLYRGIALFNKKNYDASVADFSKSIELDPKDVPAYMNRGNSYERMGDLQKAVDDYKKAVELDPANQPASSNLTRLQSDLQAKLNPEPKVAPKPVDSAPAVPAPTAKADPNQVANVGSLKNYASRLVTPVYPALERQRNVQGVVSVQITLDEEGKVVGAKAISGPPSLRQPAQDAAEKSKFKPVIAGDRAIRAMGVINYNFTVNM